MMMSTFFKNTQLPGVVILGISLLLATRTTAAEIKTKQVPDQTLAFSVPSASTHEAIAQSTSRQETGISGQSDVTSPNPTSQSLPSPAEGYGCISGYGNGTFQGDQPISRYEFAAGLNACLNRVEQLINGSTADLATQEDLAVSKRQLENLRTELERLQMRVDGVDTENRQ